MADRIGVIGLGLIGGSLAKALVAQGDPVVAWTRSPATRAAAADAGVAVADSVGDVVERVDVVVLATPLAALVATLDEVASVLEERREPAPTITDVGSVKAPIVHHAIEVLGDPSVFVGGHPIAGTERSGWAHAAAELFEATTWALVDDPPAAPERVDQVSRLVSRLGAQPVTVGVEAHDRTLALTSHLPYAVAAALTGTLAAADDPELVRRLSGASLAGATRVVRGASELGPEMVWTNREQLAGPVDDLGVRLQALAAALRAGDRAVIDATFADAHAYWATPEGP